MQQQTTECILIKLLLTLDCAFARRNCIMYSTECSRDRTILSPPQQLGRKFRAYGCLNHQYILYCSLHNLNISGINCKNCERFFPRILYLYNAVLLQRLVCGSFSGAGYFKRKSESLSESEQVKTNSLQTIHFHYFESI